MKKAEILARRVNRYLKLQESLKPVYKRLDDLLEKILKEMKPNQVAGDGILKDNYASGNVAWKSTKFERFKIERVKAA